MNFAKSLTIRAFLIIYGAEDIGGFLGKKVIVHGLGHTGEVFILAAVLEGLE